MVQDPATTLTNHSRTLEHVLRSLLHPQWCQGSCSAAKGDQPLYIIRLNFCATNIVAECEALVNALRMATELRIHRLYIRGESKVIVN
jgi:ribonuclease HI